MRTAATIASALLFLFAVSAFAGAARGDVHHNSVRRGGVHRSGAHRCDPHRDTRERIVVRVRVWIAGHYECRTERVYHPGYWEEYVEPAVYERRRVVVTDPRTGEWWYEERIVLVRPERRVRRYVPGWWEEVEVRVWVPGRWVWVVRYR